MKGHVRKRAGRYYVLIERGMQDAQVCPTCTPRRLLWLSSGERLDNCARCHGPLDEVRTRRQDQIPGGFERKKDADAALREALGRLESGAWAPPSRQTVSEYLSDWLEGAESHRGANTLALLRMVERAYIRPHIGDIKLSELTAARLEALYARLLKSGGKNGTAVSAATVRHAHSLLRKALNDAVRKDLLTRNVAAFAKPPKVERARMKTWSADQLRAFLEHVEGDRLHAAYFTAATTGMRRGELLGLRWSDVDLDAARLSVRGSLLIIDGQTRLVDATKTDGSRRSITIDPSTVVALRAHRARQAQERLALGEDYDDRDLVFARETGEWLSPVRVSRDFKRHADDAGLPTIRFHDLRHTHATLALQAGVHPKVVQERLGHASITMTLDTYSHVIPSMQADAATVIAQSIFGVR